MNNSPTAIARSLVLLFPSRSPDRKPESARWLFCASSRIRRQEERKGRLSSFGAVSHAPRRHLSRTMPLTRGPRRGRLTGTRSSVVPTPVPSHERRRLSALDASVNVLENFSSATGEDRRHQIERLALERRKERSVVNPYRRNAGSLRRFRGTVVDVRAAERTRRHGVGFAFTLRIPDAVCVSVGVTGLGGTMGFVSPENAIIRLDSLRRVGIPGSGRCFTLRRRHAWSGALARVGERGYFRSEYRVPAEQSEQPETNAAVTITKTGLDKRNAYARDTLKTSSTAKRRIQHGGDRQCAGTSEGWATPHMRS